MGCDSRPAAVGVLAGLEALEVVLVRRGDLVVSAGVVGVGVPCLRVAAVGGGGVVERVTVEPEVGGAVFVLARGERWPVADVAGTAERVAAVLGAHVGLRVRADARAVGAVRAWCRRVLAGCAQLGDAMVCVSELLGNVVRHGGEAPVPSTVTFWHEGSALLGEVRHPMADDAVRPATPDHVLDELAALAALTEGAGPPGFDLAALSEGGRGLVVVRGLADDVSQTRTPSGLVTVWRQTPCGCVRPTHTP
ncbi:ATP-binding protein [Actinocorallia sp. A-T 12471]|uniref:ATP-binding protein n=1 Tax=Actinocorallia sp. A-T 12471 TaxID=3089813 RepID=UPI0029CEBF06|nr:ATP-binding protein [Actinocorallia sp. A-T 12471]MDX6743015.1 ATP-binding protein [Actinocorallia sp. A-T 12471]